MKYRIVYMDFSELLLILTLPGHFYEIYYAYVIKGFPGGSDGKESACNAGDLGSIPGSARSPGEGNGNPLQSSYLENSIDRGAWRAIVHEVARDKRD